MNRYACFIFLSSILFFGFFKAPKPFRTQEKIHFESILRGLPAPSNQGAALWRGLVVGDTRGLSRSEIRTYYQLGLGHLFTPSGIHLATLNPLWSRIRWVTPLFCLIALLALAAPGFGALSRVSFVKALPKPCFSFATFILVLCLEGIFNSWSSNALSWTCSWLFLGVSWFAPKRQRILWFVLAQLLLCWVLSKPFSMISPIVNLLVGLPLAVLFPITLALSPVPSFGVHDFVVELLQRLHLAIVWVDGVHSWVPALTPHFGHILLLLVWILTKGRSKILSASLILLLLGQPVNGFPPEGPSTHKWEVVLPREAQVSNGVTISNGWKCRPKWRENRWEIMCRPSKRGGTRGTRKLSLRR